MLLFQRKLIKESALYIVTKEMERNIKWTDAEISELVSLHNKEEGKYEISELLNKPLNAVKYKIKQLIKEGVIVLKFKRCYICKSKMLPTERFSKCITCFQKDGSGLFLRVINTTLIIIYSHIKNK